MQEIITTTVFEKNLLAYDAGKRAIINCGGTSSGKTHSIMQLLVLIARHSKTKILISVVAESFPHIRRGSFRTFEMIMGSTFNHEKFNKSSFIYEFENAEIEFFSADDSSKLRGGRRDILFINECNNVTKEAFDELDVRTRKCTFLDFNPVSDFWAFEMEKLPFVEWIHSTYLDALDVLERSVVDNILSRRERDINWFRVYGLGLVGKIEGLCHPFFFQFDIMPEKFDREIYGLDFGYSMDPAVLVQNRIVGDTIFSRQLFYEKEMTNDRIAKRMEACGVRKGIDIVIADSAEPKSIAEIKAFGFDIRPSTKGPDSVNQGIQRVNQFKQGWSKDSLECIKEQRNYRWDKDADGKFLDKPISDWNHGIDARRYACSTIPEAKVLPPAIRVENFDLVWDISKIPEKECLHYAAASMTEDMALHIVASIWDCIDGVLYIYHAERIESITPAFLVPALVEVMHLNEFYFEKFLANDKMMSDDRSMAKVLNREFSKACFRQQIKLREPKRFDPFGAIGLTNQMIQQGRLVIHEQCADMVADMQTWQVEGGKVKIYGLRESLIMLVSELDQKEVIRPAIMLGGYKKLYEISYGF